MHSVSEHVHYKKVRKGKKTLHFSAIITGPELLQETSDTCWAAEAYPVLSLRKVDMRSRTVPSASTTSRPVTLPCMDPYRKYLSPPDSMVQAVSDVGTLLFCCFEG